MTRAIIIPHAAPDAPDCRALTALFYELLAAGLDVQVCGGTMKKPGWDQTYPLPGISKRSMKTLSTLMTEADEIATF